MKTKTLTVPHIHANGTPKSKILADLAGAYNTLEVAKKAMMGCAPNARDYDWQEPFNKACDEHYSRAYRIDMVMTELQAMITAIERGHDVADIHFPEVNDGAC